MPAGSDSFCLQTLTGNLLQELDFHPDFQMVEFGVGQIVPVKIELRPVRRFDESISIGEQFRDAAMQRDFMHLYIAPLFTDEVLQLSYRGFKGIANDDVDILMAVDAIDDDLGSGHCQIDVNLIRPALRVVLAGGADGHLAVHDMVTEFVELFGALADFRFDSIGVKDVDKADMQWNDHDETFHWVRSA